MNIIYMNSNLKVTEDENNKLYLSDISIKVSDMLKAHRITSKEFLKLQECLQDAYDVYAISQSRDNSTVDELELAEATEP